MKQSIKGLLIFSVIIVLAFMVGSYILTATFFGLISLVGLIILIESIQPLKWLLSRTSKIVDMCLFIFTILATINYGLNIAAALTVMGVGYTLVYAPWLREQLQEKVSKNAPIGNYKSKFNAK